MDAGRPQVGPVALSDNLKIMKTGSAELVGASGRVLLSHIPALVQAHATAGISAHPLNGASRQRSRFMPRSVLSRPFPCRDPNQTYNARRRRVLDGKAPNQVAAERLNAEPELANPAPQGRAGPYDATKARLVVGHAKEVSQSK